MDSRANKKLLRARLIESRAALVNRSELETQLQRRVADWLHHAGVHALGFYFPIRGEPDLRAVIAAWIAADSRRVAALPVVDGNVLAFQAWTADAPMRAGDAGIPVPAQGRAVQPECLLIPCLGFDEQRFRLGYGGGFYDRTLAALIPFPLVVGVAFEVARLQTIDPQPHDIKMDVVITEAAVY